MLKKENLMKMAETRGEWCVSVYLPLSDAEAKKKRRRLKNPMFEAEKKLHRLEVKPDKIARLLGPFDDRRLAKPVLAVWGQIKLRLVFNRNFGTAAGKYVKASFSGR